MENPFRPSFGAAPLEIIGRAGLLDEFAYGLRLGSGAPGLLAIVTGARGLGKTTTLGAAGDIATARGWAVISETATAGFMKRIAEAMRLLVGQSGTTRQVSWRVLGEDLLRHLSARGAGLIIAVDDINAAGRPELEQLAATVQHFIRDGLPVGLVLAGRPDAAAVLLDEGPATFLRRADRIDLEPLPVDDVEASFAGVFAAAGFDGAPEALHRAAAATEGLPYLVQIVGYCLWQEAEKAGTLSVAAADRALTRAGEWYSGTVVEEELPTASSRDMETLRVTAAFKSTTSPQLARATQATENVWKSIKDKYGMLTSMEVARLIGSGKSSRSPAADQRSAGKLIGIKHGNRYVYPGFQFDQRAHKVHPAIPGLLKMAGEVGWDEEDLIFWLVSPSGYFDGDRPVDHLDDADLVDKGRQSATVEW